MITDSTLTTISNVLGSGAMALIVVYHILAVSTMRQVESLSNAAAQSNHKAVNA
ncbi:Uncharacterized protein MSYG_4024 [Malassezia sympodialis ATCC 42132]|uniref:Dolichyl-diphosphooligosaccharide--protein glycosyltransferase subunit 4 n=1 Tax=Malassezia sympodialis (strain ATCC 42132) TaxID=1230383 RepID=A0A1M8ABU9_MALS4|nr:Uncharacterized protein MSYG_4024 [Malassezia sympodialis ATCC 42132]